MRRLTPTTYFDRYKLSVAQRAFLVPYFGITGILDPTQGDRIAGLGDVTSMPVLHRLKRDLLSCEQGRKLLADKPLLTSSTLNREYLQSLPQNSLGYGYFKYMDEHGFSTDERNIVRFAEDADLAYILVRYRQVHDFWHVLSDLPPTVLGEVALKCVEYQVTGLPVALMSGVFGQLRLPPNELRFFYEAYVPWIMKFDPARYHKESGYQRNPSIVEGAQQWLRDGPNNFQLIRHLLNVLTPPLSVLDRFAGPLTRPIAPNRYAIDLLSYRYEDNLTTDVEKVREELKFPIAPKF